jgi:hypothetical protein
MAVHSAIKWRIYVALPEGAPLYSGTPSPFSDVAPFIGQAAITLTYVTIGLLWAWKRKRRTVTPARLPVPAPVQWVVMAGWMLYIGGMSLAGSPVTTNADVARGWAWATVRWSGLLLAWVVTAWMVPHSDRVAVQPHWTPSGPDPAGPLRPSRW